MPFCAHVCEISVVSAARMSAFSGAGGAIAESDLATAATTVVVTIAASFAVLVVVGFAVVARRTRRARRSGGRDELTLRADQLLVRLDDAIADSVDELGFAQAQFGAGRSAPLEAAIASARAMLTSAFAVKQKLDDQGPASATERREAGARIMLQCETALDRLEKERGVLDSLRGLERSAGADLVVVRALIESTRGRLDSAADTVSTLSREFAISATAPISENVAQATRLLDAASDAATDAGGRVDPAGVGDASGEIRRAERDAERARQLLDAVGAHRERLRAASARLDSAVRSGRRDLDAARVARDAALGAGAGAAAGSGSIGSSDASGAIGDAIAYVERTLLGVPNERRDPDVAIARIEAALDALDTALATARSQQQRLDHARAALTGAMLTARSQIEVTRAYITGRRGGAGAEARTRLAEAERLLGVASAETDPLIALDTARSSATYSRDADALARYDLLH